MLSAIYFYILRSKNVSLNDTPMRVVEADILHAGCPIKSVKALKSTTAQHNYSYNDELTLSGVSWRF